MKLLFITFLCIIMYFGVFSQHNINQIMPDRESNYRFIGDTTTYCNNIQIVNTLDNLNVKCYKAYKTCIKKEWSKHYGYVKVWWIDYTTNKWTYRWMMCYYWTYHPIIDYNEVVFYTLKDKRRSIEYLNSL